MMHHMLEAKVQCGLWSPVVHYWVIGLVKHEQPLHYRKQPVQAVQGWWWQIWKLEQKMRRSWTWQEWQAGILKHGNIRVSHKAHERKWGSKQRWDGSSCVVTTRETQTIWQSLEGWKGNDTKWTKLQLCLKAECTDPTVGLVVLTDLNFCLYEMPTDILPSNNYMISD